MNERLFGREISETEWTGDKDDLLAASNRPAMQKMYAGWQCVRCGSSGSQVILPNVCNCNEACFYCTNCINMGKVRTCSTLYSYPEPNEFPLLTENPLVWDGVLSTQQAQASVDVVEAVEEKKTRLIWAVAGAGKTEMIFAGISKSLMKRGRVCIASPRIDVCLELAPRIKAAFPNVPLVVLYGGMEEEYRYTPLVIATTHQLLRFKEAFDLLIIDEVDSFPYHNNAALQYGAEKARKKESTLLFLSATPTRRMQQEVKQEKLAATILPARYHGHPLPVPEAVWLGDWRKHIQERNGRAKLLKIIKGLVAKKRRFLLFLPNITLMEQLTMWMQERLPEAMFTSVHAEDPERVEKVKQMRNEDFDFLITSTILERGVTFRDIDVFVLGAEDDVFTESSLVQIAGRVGRHQDYPTGNVWYGHYGKSRAMKGAIKQIKSMNQQATQRGLLHELSSM